MYPQLADDREHLPALLAAVSVYAADVLARLDDAPAAAVV